MAYHSTAQLEEVHAPISYEYDTAASRLAATGFIATDCNKLARQLDDNSVWLLSQPSPPIWINLGGGSPGVTTQQPTTAGILSDGLPHSIDLVSYILFRAVRWSVVISTNDGLQHYYADVSALYDGVTVHYNVHSRLGADLAITLSAVPISGNIALQVASTEVQTVKASVVRTPILIT
jgi:hypothetical protein